MNYKKSILSVVLWFIYAIIVGTGMVGTAMAVTLPAYGALIITGVWLAVTGLAVFLLHRFLEKTKHPFSEDGQQIKLIAESLLVVALIAAGIVLRTGEIMRYDLSAGGGNIWFDTVMVTENTQIPQVVHGAVYFYLQVLHGLLVFLGNKMTAALILQVILQILSGIFSICIKKNVGGGNSSGDIRILDAVPGDLRGGYSGTGNVVHTSVDDWVVHNSRVPGSFCTVGS